MTIRNKLATGAFGYVLSFPVSMDLSGATAKFSASRPNGSRFEASAVIDPVSKIISYTVTDTDFPIQGIYKAHLIVEFGSEKRLKSDAFYLEVESL